MLTTLEIELADYHTTATQTDGIQILEKNAPKNIVDNDKVLLRDLSIEENKLRSIVSSIN